MSITNNDLKLIEIIKKYINNDKILNNKFNHHNQKYHLDELLKYIIIILKTGIAFRNINSFTTIHSNTIYKFFQKLCKYNVFNRVQLQSVSCYLNLTVDNLKDKNFPYLLYTDTTLIPNKLGGELIAYNPQLKKHKSTKISIITDMFSFPISTKIYPSNFYDSKIFSDHLKSLQNDSPILFNSNNILFGDTAYDSNILKKFVNESKFGKLITPTNIPNTKNINKINSKKTSFIDNILLKKRIIVENIICKLKKYKRINVRYDRELRSYCGFLSLAILHILSKTL